MWQQCLNYGTEAGEGDTRRDVLPKRFPIAFFAFNVFAALTNYGNDGSWDSNPADYQAALHVISR